MTDTYKNPTLDEIRTAFAKVEPVLTELARPDFDFGEYCDGKYHYTWSKDLQRVADPVHAMMPLFTWEGWPDHIDWLRQLDLTTADIHSLGKYLFAIYRRDRYVEGLLFCCYKDGTIYRILARMKEELERA